MYNLLVGCTAGEGPATLAVGRMFEYTEDRIRDMFKIANAVRFDDLRRLPCLFMDEGLGDEIAHVGRITMGGVVSNEARFQIAYENGIAPLRNSRIADRAAEFGLADWEFSRTHWAVKDIDLYRAILRTGTIERQLPRAFNIAIPELIVPRQISVMMPFDGTSHGVYEAIKARLEPAYVVNRGDDIWQHDTIIQDVVSLIDRSKVVICDLSRKNPNVFYETGIAHALGRHVILITQSRDDVPFDLQHIRYIPYLNNDEGRVVLVQRILDRVIELAA